MKKSFLKINILIYLTLSSLISSGQVIINEYSVSNLTGYLDNYDTAEDWIELYNTSNSSVDIGGYFLSDDNTNPNKWEIPSGTTISANGYRTFWASGRDEVSSGNYHTNFKLKQSIDSPEYVVFSDPSSNIINEFQLEITQLEHSRGRHPMVLKPGKYLLHQPKGYTIPGNHSQLIHFHQ